MKKPVKIQHRKKKMREIKFTRTYRRAWRIHPTEEATLSSTLSYSHSCTHRSCKPRPPSTANSKTLETTQKRIKMTHRFLDKKGQENHPWKTKQLCRRFLCAATKVHLQALRKRELLLCCVKSEKVNWYIFI